MPKINAAGLDIIKEFEGLVLTAYQDSGGVWTIGYGHTGLVNEKPITAGMFITLDTAEDELAKDLAYFERGVNNLLTHSINSNQFSALVSFAYNEGVDALAQSTLMADVNAGKYADAVLEFGNWIYDNGEILEGLVRRRLAEQQLFEKPE